MVLPFTTIPAKAYCAVAGVDQDILPNPSVVNTCPESPSEPLILNLAERISILCELSIFKASVLAVPNFIYVFDAVVPIDKLPSDTTVCPSRYKLSFKDTICTVAFDRVYPSPELELSKKSSCVVKLFISKVDLLCVVKDIA